MWRPGCALLLLLLTSACAAGLQPETELKARNVGPEEIEAEPSDRACSYFYYLWGKSAELRHRYDEALEAYEKARLCDERSEFLIREVAILLIKMNRKEEAVERLAQVSETNPRDVELHFLLAKLYSTMGRNEAAAAAYRRILEIEEDPDALLMLGALYAEQHEYEKAREILNRLIELDDDSYMGHYYLARMYRELRYFDKAFAAYERAMAISWSTRLAFELAAFYEEQQRNEEAAALYRRIIARDEGNETARTRLVNLLLAMDNADDALEELRELRNHVRDPVRVDETIGRVLMAREEYDQAADILERILEEKPDRSSSRYLLALVLYQRGDREAARREAAMIPAGAEEFEDAVRLRLQVHRDREETEAAVRLLERLLTDEQTRRVSFYLMLASLYREQGKEERVLAVLEQGENVFPGDTEMLYGSGLVLERLGRQDAALAKMQAILEQDSDHAAALNYVGYTWADRGINLERARKYIEKAVELRPEDGFIRDSLGWVYYRLGDFERAVAELERAVELEESDPVIFDHLGDAYRRTGDLPRAADAYRKAMDLYEEDEKLSTVREKLERILNQ